MTIFFVFFDLSTQKKNLKEFMPTALFILILIVFDFHFFLPVGDMNLQRNFTVYDWIGLKVKVFISTSGIYSNVFGEFHNRKISSTKVRNDRFYFSWKIKVSYVDQSEHEFTSIEYFIKILMISIYQHKLICKSHSTIAYCPDVGFYAYMNSWNVLAMTTFLLHYLILVIESCRNLF